MVGEGGLLRSGKGSGASVCTGAGFVGEVILLRKTLGLGLGKVRWLGSVDGGECVVDCPIGIV